MIAKFMRSGVSSTALVLALAASPAMAQTQAAAPEAAETGVTDIVVTAQRREERLQNVPIAVTAVAGDTLISRGVTDVSMLSKFVPGFNFGRTGSDARPAMRGIRTANNEVTGDPVIGYYIDGIYQSRTSQALLGFVDVARVEVQRGPQGTLYGRNTIGGNITVTTNEPTDDVSAALTYTVANFHRLRAEGYVNAPLGEGLAIRIAGAYEDQRGYVKNDYNPSADLFDVSQRFIRGTAKFQSGDFKAVLRASYSHSGGNGDSAFGYKQIGTYVDPATCQALFNATTYLLNSRGNNLDGVNDCTTTAATPTRAAGVGVDLGIPIYKPGARYVVDNDYRTFRDMNQFQTSLDMSYDVGPFALRSITGYVDYTGNRTSDSDFSASSIAIDLQNTTTKTFSQEIQILSNPGGSIDYVAGLFYYEDRLGSLFINQQLPAIVRSTALNYAPVLRPQANGTYNYNRTRLDSKAAYAQVTWHATDQLSFTGGLRYTSDKKKFFNASANGILPAPVAGGANPLTLITINTPLVPDSVYGAVPSCGTGTTATINVDASGRYVGANYCPRTFNQVTYRGGVDYQVTPRNLLYATVSSGFRSGGFNAGQLQAANAPTFEPEKVTAFEIGSKNRFFDNTVQFNLSAFYNKYSALQEPRPINIGSTVISVTFNAATARAYGLEAEAIWQPTKALTLGANISLLDAKYRSFTNVPLPYGASILVNDASVTAPTIVNGITIAPIGQRRIFAPGYSCTPLAGTGGAGQPALSFGCDLSGNNIPHSPRYSGSAYASYDFDLGDMGTITPLAAVTFSGGYDEQSFNDRLGRSPGYAKLDLNLTWKVNDNFTAEAFGTNVTSTLVRTIVSYGGTPLQASYEPPAQYGLRLTAKY
jgi:iron complex outermembrane recepter protein